jgi:hypothetical protein
VAVSPADPIEPCKCATLALQKPRDISSITGHTDNRNPRLETTRITMIIPYVLTCTGGAGKCDGEINVVPPDGWYGTGWYQVLPVPTAKGKVYKVGDPVGGKLQVTCSGTCGADPTSGSYYLKSRIDRELASTTVTFKLEVTCPAGTQSIWLLNFTFNRFGGIVQRETTLMPA